MIFLKVIADLSALVFSRAEENIDRGQIAHGGLGIDVELAHRLNVVAKELDADRQRGLPRVKIDDAATDSELAAGGNLRDALVTGAAQRFEKIFASCSEADCSVPGRGAA